MVKGTKHMVKHKWATEAFSESQHMMKNMISKQNVKRIISRIPQLNNAIANQYRKTCAI